MSGFSQAQSAIRISTKKCWPNLSRNMGYGTSISQSLAAGESHARIRATVPGETMRFAVTLTTWRHGSLSREWRDWRKGHRERVRRRSCVQKQSGSLSSIILVALFSGAVIAVPMFNRISATPGARPQAAHSSAEPLRCFIGDQRLP